MQVCLQYDNDIFLTFSLCRLYLAFECTIFYLLHSFILLRKKSAKCWSMWSDLHGSTAYWCSAQLLISLYSQAAVFQILLKWTARQDKHIYLAPYCFIIVVRLYLSNTWLLNIKAYSMDTCDGSRFYVTMHLFAVIRAGNLTFSHCHFFMNLNWIKSRNLRYR